MYAVVSLQLVFEAELFATAVAFIRFLSSMDALVALQCALIPKAAATELALVWVVTCSTETSHLLTLLLYNKALKIV